MRRVGPQETRVSTWSPEGLGVASGHLGPDGPTGPHTRGLDLLRLHPQSVPEGASPSLSHPGAQSGVGLTDLSVSGYINGYFDYGYLYPKVFTGLTRGHFKVGAGSICSGRRG